MCIEGKSNLPSVYQLHASIEKIYTLLGLYWKYNKQNSFFRERELKREFASKEGEETENTEVW